MPVSPLIRVTYLMFCEVSVFIYVFFTSKISSRGIVLSLWAFSMATGETVSVWFICLFIVPVQCNFIEHKLLEENFSIVLALQMYSSYVYSVFLYML